MVRGHMLLSFLLAIALCSFTVMQISPSELEASDLLLAIAGFSAIAISGWLLIKITHMLDDLSKP
jgi:hypothetical protein